MNVVLCFEFGLDVFSGVFPDVVRDLSGEYCSFCCCVLRWVFGREVNGFECFCESVGEDVFFGFDVSDGVGVVILCDSSYLYLVVEKGLKKCSFVCDGACFICPTYLNYWVRWSWLGRHLAPIPTSGHSQREWEQLRLFPGPLPPFPLAVTCLSVPSLVPSLPRT